MTPPHIESFSPIAAPDSRVLILGSMPGDASLKAGQYYAHKRNAFWRIMGELFGAGLEKPYDERVRILDARGIALWDVLQSCVRAGSLDSNITTEMPNDFAAFFKHHPHIARIGLNGGKPAASFRRYAATFCPAHVVVTQLPSTSPAHAARSFEQKLSAWREGLGM